MSKFYCSFSKAGTGFMINLNNVSRISYEPVTYPRQISFTMAHEFVHAQSNLYTTSTNKTLDIKFEDESCTKSEFERLYKILHS